MEGQGGKSMTPENFADILRGSLDAWIIISL
jgi:hypothetical protein